MGEIHLLNGVASLLHMMYGMACSIGVVCSIM